MKRIGLENQEFYLPDIFSPKNQDNPEMPMVLRFKIILNVMVRVRFRDRIGIRILVLTLTLNLTVYVLLLVTF